MGFVLPFGCEGPADGVSIPCELTYALLDDLRLDEVRHPRPVVGGTSFEVRGEGFLIQRNCVESEVELIGWTDDQRRRVMLGLDIQTINTLSARLNSDSADYLGPNGTFDGDLLVRYRAVDSGRVFEASVGVTFPLTRDLIPRVTGLSVDRVYLEDEIILEGEDFLDGDEGGTEIVVDGVFLSEDGELHTVQEIVLPAELVDIDDRSRVTFRWSPAIAGLAPGRFEGSVTPINAHEPDGRRLVGHALAAEIDQVETALFRFSPETASLGQIVEIVGRGFIGASDGVTTIHFDGIFTPRDSRPETFLQDLVGRWNSGGSISYDVVVTSSGDYLRSYDFDVQRGEFVGWVVPILTTDNERYEGIGAEVRLLLGPVRQICWVRFLPGFSDSLELLGLGALDLEIRRRVLERMTDIYRPPERPEDWVNVEFRFSEPTDFYPGGYAVLDIGGADPNQLGLFGYDSAPNKDVGNLRLHDHIGGENSLGGLDGYGYGGVFIESMMFWSAMPPVDERPAAAPEVDPLFDQVFDGVRYQEVVAGEWPDGASAARLVDIELALHVISSLIADTAAHEFGHSLKLAQPYGSPMEYHNTIPRPGCLMDSGQDRPLQERGLIFGNTGSGFCGENLWYLQELLPME